MLKPLEQQKNNTLTTRLTKSEHEALNEICKRLNLKRSDLIRQWINQNKQTKDILPIDK